VIIFETWNIVVIATRDSDNRKTGKMIQLWVINRNIHPVESIRSGTDAMLQCRGCAFASGKGCYVGSLPLMAIWRKYSKGEYDKLEPGTQAWADYWVDVKVRFGAYGNPSLIPLDIVSDIVERCESHTGYFHDWHLMPACDAVAYGRYFMASCEPCNVAQAQAMGLRTFTVYPVDAQQGDGLECLADSKGLTCAECGLCDGTARSDARVKSLPSVFIRVHGYKARQASDVLA